MKQFLKTRGLLIGILTGVMILIAVVSLFVGAGRVNFVQDGTRTVMRPVETGIRNMVSTLERMYDYMFHYDTLYEEHQALLDRVAGYQRLAREAEAYREENVRLRELLNLRDLTEHLHYIDAHVVSWDPSNWTSAFTIDRGGDLGIEVGDPVMTERRELVGVVAEVGSSWATVQTIIDPAVQVGGQLETGVAAVAEGNFALMLEGNLRLSYVPSAEVPLLADAITTSGLGGVIPKGLLIGEIIHVGLEGTGISHYAIIEPTVDFARLVQVFVIQHRGSE